MQKEKNDKVVNAMGGTYKFFTNVKSTTMEYLKLIEKHNHAFAISYKTIGDEFVCFEIELGNPMAKPNKEVTD